MVVKSVITPGADLELEKKIGRVLLPNEVAHHMDHDRENDHPDNLQLHTEASHNALHALVRSRPQIVEENTKLSKPIITINQVLELTQAGHSLRSAARLLGTSYETIRRRLLKVPK